MSKVPQPRERALRVFISSTFRDMHADRDELVKRVFPRIRRLCEERGVAWSEVDLRWGVTDEQKAEGRVLPICLAEIERCRPYFIGLLGERYGWVPDEIAPTLISHQPWLSEQRERSVTELEILHGVLNDAAMLGHAFFYFRHPSYIDRLPPEQQAAYREIPDEAEIELYGTEAAHQRAAQRRDRLAALKDRIRSGGHSVRENYADPRQLGELVFQDLSKLIDRLFPVKAKRNDFAQQSFEHDAFARQQSAYYVPRPNLDTALDQHFGHDGLPLVLVGETGAGKTAALARWFGAMSAMGSIRKPGWRDWLVGRWRGVPTGPILCGHFVGATPNSTDWTVVVRRILHVLKQRCRIHGAIPDQSADLRFALEDWLPAASRHGPISIAIDGLDQLEHGEQQPDLGWLPAALPDGVRLAVSTRPGPVLHTLQSRQWAMLPMPPLEPAERDALIVTFLRSSGKELSATERQRIVSAAASANPLFLRILLDELRLFGAHEQLTERIDRYLRAHSVSELYAEVLERYEGDYEEDRPGLIGRMMSLLWGSHRGLAEAELLELLGSAGQPLPQICWSQVNLAAGQSLLSRSGHWTFATGALRDAVRRRYLEDPAQRRAVHARLGNYFGPPALPRRRLDEQLWQLAQAEQWTKLSAALTDMELILTAMDEESRGVQPLREGWLALKGRVDPDEAYFTAANNWVDQHGPTSKVADALLVVSRLLHGMGDSYSSQQLVERASKIRGDLRGSADDQSLAELEQLGRTLQVQDKLAEAVEVFERGEQLARRLHGRKSAEVATFRAARAGVLHLQGLDQEAVSIIEESLPILEKEYGAEHQVVLTLRGNLAVCLVNLGRRAEAREIHERVLQILERRNDPSSESVTATLISLASLHRRLKEYPRAIELAQRALVLRERALGPDHPRVGNILHNLAGIYGEAGQPAQSIPLFERCLDISLRTRGEHHSDYAITAGSLAEAYRLTGRFDEAETWSRRAVALFESLPVDDSYRIVNLKILGLIHLNQRRFDEAIADVQRALELQIAKFGEVHEETPKIYACLGEANYGKGDLANAERCFTKSASLFAATVGDDREHIFALMRLEAIVRQQGNGDGADRFQQEAQAMASRLGLTIGSAPASPAPTPPAATPSPPATPVDPQALQETRQRIQREFEELGRLARSKVRPAEFFGSWLERVASALGAHGGAIWMIDAFGNPSLEADWKLPIECRAEHSNAASHDYLLRRIADTGQVAAVPRNAALPNAPEIRNPTPYLLLLTRLSLPRKGSYLIEIAQRADCDPKSINGFSQYLVQVCQLLRHYLEHLPQTVESAREQVVQLFEETAQLAKSDVEPPEFFSGWLERLVKAIGAHGGAVWRMEALDKPSLAAEWKLPIECRPEYLHSQVHDDLLRRVPVDEQVAVLPKHTLPHAPETQNPTPYLLLLLKLSVPGNGVYLAEIAQRADSLSAAHAGYGQYLLQVGQLLRQYLQRRPTANSP